MSSSGILSRVFRAETFTCAHCGSAEVFPHPGLLGELGAALGRVRYACRDCRRTRWLRPDADEPETTPDEPLLEAPRLPGARADLDALDVYVTPLPPARADLSALDAALTAAGRRRKRR